MGAALAAQLVQAGAEVVLVGRRAPHLARVQAALALPARAEVAAVDVEDWPAVSQLAHRLHQQAGAFDGIVHAAGHFASGPLLEMDPATVSAILNTAVLGAHWVAKAFLPAMRARRAGTLVLVAAAAVAPGHGADPAGTSVPYLAAKSGVAVLGRALAAEMAGTGVRIAVVFPPTFEEVARPGILSASEVAAPIVAMLTSAAASASELVIAPG